jgi:8-oxo-dGTP pyrophosphatase MutT (NUDIX family)
VQCEGKVLLQQRGHDMRLYPSYWSGISGFLDTTDSIEDKAYEELREEAGFTKDTVLSMTRGPVLLQEAPDYNKTWFVVPVHVEVNTRETIMNWESAKLAWFDPAEISQLDLLPGFLEVLQTFVGAIL